MSTISFSFGSVLQGNFVAGNGVYVNATAFQNGVFVKTVPLVVDGQVQTILNMELAPPGQTFVSGNIVVTTQETKGSGGTPFPLPVFDPANKAFNQVASASIASANNYRYDTIELTLKNAAGDAANLTNIVQFGGPISLSANGQTRSYLPMVGTTPTGEQIVSEMLALSSGGFQNGIWLSGSTPGGSNGLAGGQREIYMGGNNGNGTSGANPLNNPTDWDGFVKGLSGIQNSIRIANFFPGVTADPGQGTKAVAPYFVYYDVSYAQDASTGTNLVTMNPVKDAAFDTLFASLGS